MKFAATTACKTGNLNVVFRETESSFDVNPKPKGGVSSVLVDYLQLEVDDEGVVLYAWGLFADPKTWKETKAYPKRSIRRALVVQVPGGVVPGVSRRLNEGHPWPVFVNRERGWVCLGEPVFPSSSESIEFATNSIAVLVDDDLVAVWLHPESLPAYSES